MNKIQGFSLQLTGITDATLKVKNPQKEVAFGQGSYATRTSVALIANAAFTSSRLCGIH